MRSSTELVACTILLTTAFALGAVSYVTEKPTYLKTCYKDAPREEFDECSRDSTQNFLLSTSNGDPKIGLVPNDPLRVPELSIIQSSSGPVSVNATLKDLVITGMKKIEILSCVVDTATYDFTIKTKIPGMRIEADYYTKGRVLLLPLRGNGHTWFEPKDVDLDLFVDREVFEKDGIKFFKVTNVKLNFEVSFLSFYMENLFDGNQLLSESMNRYLNQHWRVVGETLKPTLSEAMAQIFIHLLNQFFNNVPAKYIIGDID